MPPVDDRTLGRVIQRKDLLLPTADLIRLPTHFKEVS